MEQSKKSPTFALAKQKAIGAIAQLVEHRTENPCVPGSNPGGTTNKGELEKVLLYLCDIFCVSLYIILRVSPTKKTSALHRNYESRCRVSENSVPNRRALFKIIQECCYSFKSLFLLIFYFEFELDLCLADATDV